jgi:hypothetical protein
MIGHKIIENLVMNRGILLAKLIVAQIVKKFPASYGTLRFITVFSRICQQYLF